MRSPRRFLIIHVHIILFHMEAREIPSFASEQLLYISCHLIHSLTLWFKTRFSAKVVPDKCVITEWDEKISSWIVNCSSIGLMQSQIRSGKPNQACKVLCILGNPQLWFILIYNFLTCNKKKKVCVIKLWNKKWYIYNEFADYNSCCRDFSRLALRIHLHLWESIKKTIILQLLQDIMHEQQLDEEPYNKSKPYLISPSYIWEIGWKCNEVKTCIDQCFSNFFRPRTTLCKRVFFRAHLPLHPR